MKGDKARRVLKFVGFMMIEPLAPMWFRKGGASKCAVKVIRYDGWILHVLEAGNGASGQRKTSPHSM